MTIDEMRTLLGMPVGEYTDAQVAAAYATSLGGAETSSAGSAIDIVPLADAKRDLRVLNSDEDAFISSLITDAVAYVEAYTGLTLVGIEQEIPASTWVELEDLKVSPVASVEISYVDVDGETQTLDPDAYELIGDMFSAGVFARSGATFPTLGNARRPITVAATCGLDPSSVPNPVKRAIRFLVAQWFKSREPVSFEREAAGVPNTFADLLVNFRRFQ